MAARRGLADSTSTSSTASGVPPREKEEEGKEEEEVDATDEEAAKRAALLKRYGDRTPPSGPVAVKTTTAGGFDVDKSASAEVNHNEIWGDCKSSAGAGANHALEVRFVLFQPRHTQNQLVVG